METLTKKEIKILDELQTERAIASLKEKFPQVLREKLNLHKVEAPLLVQKGTGINDDLNGIEKPVNVKAKELTHENLEIVQSLAKWKRIKLKTLGAKPGEGLYTDMRALRPDEGLSDVHSLYVDQWDWEQVISQKDRTIDYLKKTVRQIYLAIKETELYIHSLFPSLKSFLPNEIHFIHAEDLLQQYPSLNPKQREDAIAKKFGAVFIIGIGGNLSDGKKHDGRAPDYDDWSKETSEGRFGLNGDIIVWNPVLERAFEISSMGIRVDAEALLKQLYITGHEERASLYWHSSLIKGELPYTIGGGIGQSRLSMLLLHKQHIAEVQASVWPADILFALRELGIKPLS